MCIILPCLSTLFPVLKKAAVNIWRASELQWLDSQMQGSRPEFSQVRPGLMFAGSGTEI